MALLRSGAQQDRSTLLVRIQCPCLETFDPRASDWVIDEGIAEVGHAERLGDHSTGWVEGMSAEHQPGLAGLLEGDPVVHTAR